jgi:hypothetical protein
MVEIFFIRYVNNVEYKINKLDIIYTPCAYDILRLSKAERAGL